ncbi:MAG: hypothetical protein AAFR52_12360 [Pseudomonadota bacterium]
MSTKENPAFRPIRLDLAPDDLSEAALRRAFGFLPPAPFRAVLDVFARHARGERDRFGWLVYDVLGLKLAAPSQRYGNTPPELFIFAATGVDGTHVGFLDRAPELGRDDLPVAGFAPWADGVVEIAASVFEAVGWLAGHDHVATRSDLAAASPLAVADRDAVRDDLRRLGVPVGQAAAGGHGLDGAQDRWLLLPAEDGVGAWGPQVAHNDATRYPRRGADSAVIVDAAEAMVAAGAPLDALVMLKQVFVERWSDDTQDLVPLYGAFATVYGALGRGSLVSNLPPLEARPARPAELDDVELVSLVPSIRLAGLPEIAA